MAKFINDSAMDAALAWIRDNTTMISVCGTQPTSAAQTTAATYSNGTLAYGTALWGAITNGDGTGRKIPTTAVSVPILVSGTVNHVAFTNTGTLCGVGTCAPTAVTAGGTLVVAAFDFDEISDPT